MDEPPASLPEPPEKNARSSLKRDLGLLLVLLLLAGSIRVWLMCHTDVPARDSIGYIRYAWELRHHPWREVLPREDQHPGYPLLILGMSVPVCAFSGGVSCDAMVLSAQLVSVLAGCLLVIPMFYLGVELFNRRVGFWAAALFQCFPVAARATADGISEASFLLLAALTLLLAVCAMRRQSAFAFALCGLSGGLTYLVRPEGALTVAATVLALLGMQLLGTYRLPWLKAGVCLLSLGFAALLPAAPFIAVTGRMTTKPTGQKLLQMASEERTLTDRAEPGRAQAPGTTLSFTESASGLPAPEGRKSLARGVSPWRDNLNDPQAPKGRQYCRPFGAFNSYSAWNQGLTPLANDCRPSGAQTKAISSRCKITNPSAEIPPGRLPMIGSPPLASTFGVSWLRGGEMALAKRLGESLRGVLGEISKGFLYVAWIPALLGLFWFRHRWRTVPGTLVLLTLCFLHGLVLWGMALKVGYVSERHVLLVVLCGLFWTVAGLDELARRLFGARSARLEPHGVSWLRRSTTWASLLLLALCGAGLPKSLQPLHTNHLGHRAAGLWLAEHVQPADIIFDPFSWAQYYAGRVLQETTPPALSEGAHGICYVVVDNSPPSSNQQLLLPGVALARLLAGQGKAVYEWRPENGKSKGAEEVRIYRLSLDGP